MYTYIYMWLWFNGYIIDNTDQWGLVTMLSMRDFFLLQSYATEMGRRNRPEMGWWSSEEMNYPWFDHPQFSYEFSGVGNCPILGILDITL